MTVARTPLARFIKEKLDERDMPVMKLAEFSGVGRSTIYRILLDETVPSTKTLYRILRYGLGLRDEEISKVFMLRLAS